MGRGGTAAGRGRIPTALIVAETDSPFVLVVTLPPCSVCGGPIPLWRVVDAEGRGRSPLFCKERCSQIGTKRNSRANAAAGRIADVRAIVGPTSTARGTKPPAATTKRRSGPR